MPTRRARALTTASVLILTTALLWSVSAVATAAPSMSRGDDCIPPLCEPGDTTTTEPPPTSTEPPATTTTEPATTTTEQATTTTTATTPPPPTASTATTTTEPAQTTTLFTLPRQSGPGATSTTTLEFVPGAAYTTATWPIVVFILSVLGVATVLGVNWYRTRDRT